VVTFGCRVNQADSLGLEEQLCAAGAVAASPRDADLVVVNTCSVTATADQGARQTIRRIARDNPQARIVVTGCYATRRPGEISALPNVAQVVGNDDKPRLLQLITRATVASGDGPCGAAIEPGAAGRTAFTLRVQSGCAEPCSYCIIPSTRGAPRSVPIPDVLREVDRVAAAGFKEIILTGVHLGSYGRDLTPAVSLFELLTTLDQSRTPAFAESSGGSAAARSASGGGSRSGERAHVLFRISSLEPMDCSRDIVELVAASDRFAPHFHLPLQHASDRILSAMRRPYTIDYYASLVDGIRARIPRASIGSDIIVGFPGETDEDFDELASYLGQSPLTHVHVFPYSDRPGTVASTMGGRAPGAVVRERARRAREVGARLTERFHASQIGSVHRALTLDDGTVAVTGNYVKLRIPGGCRRNEWITVRVVAGCDAGLEGEVVYSPNATAASCWPADFF
jgi:threonylcarbamoyladenosine tRNA methylthiotransferase MtaB